MADGGGARALRSFGSRRTFRDADLDRRLRHDGFVLVDIDPHSVDLLSSGLDDLGIGPGDPRVAGHSSFQSYDRDYKRGAAMAIEAALAPELDRLLDRHRPLPGSFITKWPGSMSGFGAHQDLSMLDERHHASVVVWAPLDECTAENGELWVVPGSHRWRTEPRGIHAFGFPFTEVAERLVRRHSVPTGVQPGQMVIFDNALLHWSAPNRSDRPRRAALWQLVPEEVSALQYFGDGRGVVDVYEVSDDAFWFDNHPLVLWRPPTGVDRVAVMRGATDHMDHAELDHLVGIGAAVEGRSPGDLPYLNLCEPWCYRCGGPAPERPMSHPWVGNTTQLCTACEVEELARAGVPGGAAGFATDDARSGWARDGHHVERLAPDVVDRLVAVLDRPEAVEDVVRPVLRDIIPGYELLPGGRSLTTACRRCTGLHRDHLRPATADAMIVWIPLGDRRPGVVRIVSGSHRADGARTDISVHLDRGSVLFLDPTTEHLIGGDPGVGLLLAPRYAPAPEGIAHEVVVQPRPRAFGRRRRPGRDR